MNATGVKIIVYYNKRNITQNISKYILSLTYTDYEKDNSDELEIRVKDNHKIFQKSRILKGDKLTAYIGYTDGALLNCGTFTIDETEFSRSSSSDEFSIRALAASVNQTVRQKNSISYKNKTLIQIAREIAKKHGYTVAGKYGFAKIGYVAQLNESDLAFLARIARLYGYIFKLTDTVITFIPDDTYEKKGVIATIEDKDIDSVSIKDNSVKTYSQCSVKYLGKKGKLTTYTAKGSKTSTSKDTLKLSVKCGNKNEAIRVANAGLKNGSKTAEGHIDLKKGYPNMIAGVNFNLILNNAYDGKYHVKQSTHTIDSSGYKTSVEIEGK